MERIDTGFLSRHKYQFPPEWAPHRATWLSWPHKEASWPGKLNCIFPSIARFVQVLTLGERVCINVNDEAMRQQAIGILAGAGVNLDQVDFFTVPTNDAWCRDHGPAFLTSPVAAAGHQKIIIDWKYNAWGDKYAPYDLDDRVPTAVGEALGIPVVAGPIVMEGGSVDFNGEGTLLTTRSCLLNKNRNPGYSEIEIEAILKTYYGVKQVLWLGDGIEGDDTDGHIDDITRFVSCDTVITVTEANKDDPNYEPLLANRKALDQMKLVNGRPLNIIELPMPAPVYYEGTRLPASYANFYIANSAVVVPVFNDPNDRIALDILQQAFPGRKILGIDSTDIIWGLGSFHCLSQQEPQA